MTFKKSSELDKDNATNVDSESNKPSSAKESRRVALRIIGITLSLLFLITFWFIATIVMPLSRGSGVEKYTGDFRELAEGIYEFESSQKAGDPMPTWLEQYHIEDIHLTTDEERAQYCTDYPERMTTDPNRTMSYTVVYSERPLGGFVKSMHTIVGCETWYENVRFFK